MRDSHRQPGTAARYVVVVEVTPSAASTPSKAIAEVYPHLVDRLKNAGITYQKIETDEAARTISFYLIDDPANEGATMKYPVAYFEEALLSIIEYCRRYAMLWVERLLALPRGSLRFQ